MLQVYARVGITLVEVYQRVGNLSFGSIKGLTDVFYGFIKSRKRSIFVTDFYLKDRAFTAVKRNTKFLTRYVKRVQFVNRGYTKGLPFS